MAGLGNRATLHIDSHCMREVLQDRAHLLLTIYKPLSTDNLSCMYLRMDVVWKMIDGKCLLYILLWSLEGGWHTQNLSKFTFIAAISVMIYTLCCHYDLGDIEVDISSTCNTG